MDYVETHELNARRVYRKDEGSHVIENLRAAELNCHAWSDASKRISCMQQ